MFQIVSNEEIENCKKLKNDYSHPLFYMWQGGWQQVGGVLGSITG